MTNSTTVRKAALLVALAKAARLAVEAAELRGDLDCDQFAFEMLGVVMAYHHVRRLLRDPKADARAKRAFERLLTTNAAS